MDKDDKVDLIGDARPEVEAARAGFIKGLDTLVAAHKVWTARSAGDLGELERVGFMAATLDNTPGYTRVMLLGFLAEAIERLANGQG